MSRKNRAPKQYVPNDKYFYKAKSEGYRARSAYKLLEIQERFNLIKPGDTVLDLGAAPGSFLQVVHRLFREECQCIGIDLTKIKSLKKPHISTYLGDVFDEARVTEVLQKHNCRKVDVLISDIAPKTMGIRDIDQWASVELNMQIIKIADIYLKTGGNLLLKVFQGEDFHELIALAKKHYEYCTVHKPKACRERSYETYVICRNKTPQSVIEKESEDDVQ